MTTDITDRAANQSAALASLAASFNNLFVASSLANLNISVCVLPTSDDDRSVSNLKYQKTLHNNLGQIIKEGFYYLPYTA